ncbi:MAG: hypothetical protein PVJ57_02780 [Phycisphaerae bacterium]|jgi:hypothetical protein
MDTKETRGLTPEQVMRGMRRVWKRCLTEEMPDDPNTRVDRWLEQKGLDDIDLSDVLFELDRFCGHPRAVWLAWKRQSLPEWKQHFGMDVRSRAKWEAEYGPRCTFAEFARFIAGRASAPTLEPVVVLGKPCLTAGAFGVIEHTVAAMQPGTPRFAPSTPVADVIRGRCLRQVWERLRWISEDRLPPLRPTWTDRLTEGLESDGRVLLVLIIIAASTILLHLLIGGPCFLSVVGGVLAFLGMRAVWDNTVRGAEWHSDPLPENLRDFRAVARAMVGT